MQKDNVKIGETYVAKVGGNLVPIIITGTPDPDSMYPRKFRAINKKTKRLIKISPQRIIARSDIYDEVVRRAAHRAAHRTVDTGHIASTALATDLEDTATA